MKEAENKKLISVNLEKQQIISEKDHIIKFDIDSFRKKCLLEGLDDIALTMKNSEKIDMFENQIMKSKSWLTL